MSNKSVPMIGPFFYVDGEFLSHRIPVLQGDKRGGKLDNPYSHEILYDDFYSYGDFINIPRGRVVWDTETGHAIIYIDVCIEVIEGAVEKLSELFGLADFTVEHDDHYVCPHCIGNIWGG